MTVQHIGPGKIAYVQHFTYEDTDKDQIYIGVKDRNGVMTKHRIFTYKQAVEFANLILEVAEIVKPKESRYYFLSYTKDNTYVVIDREATDGDGTDQVLDTPHTTMFSTARFINEADAQDFIDMKNGG